MKRKKKKFNETHQKIKIQKKDTPNTNNNLQNKDNEVNTKMIEIEFLQYNEIAKLDIDKKIKTILDHIKSDKIVFLDGLLNEDESKELFKKTMEEFDFKFKGIEISSISPKEYESKNFLKKFKINIINFLQGKKSGITVIGPANIVKKIKQDPNKISLFMDQ